MRFRNNDLLLRIAQGDAYGAGFEFVHPAFIRERNRLERFERHPKHGGCAVYTDDAQMSIAVAEVLIAGPPFTRLAFANAFVRCFRRDQRKGYAREFQKFLESVKTGAEFLDRIRTDSVKNGACMRAVPIGALPKIVDVLAVAETQARITHDTQIGVSSAQAVALMAHFALYDSDGFDRLGAYLTAHCTGWITPRDPWTEPVKNPATNTVHAVYDLLRYATTQREVLDRAIALGGDTDSVAAIALGIASCRFHDPLPEFLERDLEPDGKYGVAFLKDLGARLMAKHM